MDNHVRLRSKKEIFGTTVKIWLLGRTSRLTGGSGFRTVASIHERRIGKMRTSELVGGTGKTETPF